MKKLLFTLIATLLLTSCAIYEDIYLNSDKSITYQSTFEITESNGMEGMLKNKFPADSIISMKDVLAEELAKGSELTDEQKAYLESLGVFTLRMKTSDDGKKYQIILGGDFKDDKHLNKTMEDMAKLMTEAQNANSSSKKMDFINTQWNISWDGKTMKRNYFESEVEEIEDEESESTNKGFNAEMMKKIVNGQIRYHFPKKVKSVNQADALMSQDGKTVIVIPNHEAPKSDLYTIEIKVK